MPVWVILILVVIGVISVGILATITMPPSGSYDCPHCGGFRTFDIPHTCKPLSKAQVREIVQEVIKEQQKTGFPLYDDQGSYLERE